MDQEVLTYYPGDRMVLEVEIEHKPNFRRVHALFAGRREGGEDAQAHQGSTSTNLIIVRKMKADGTKTSAVRFEETASRNHWVPGLVYELTDLRVETAGNLPGESNTGSAVAFDMSGIEVSRLRFEGEAKSRPTKLRSARLH